MIALALGCGGAARAQLAITQPTTKLLILPRLILDVGPFEMIRMRGDKVAFPERTFAQSGRSFWLYLRRYFSPALHHQGPEPGYGLVRDAGH